MFIDLHTYNYLQPTSNLDLSDEEEEDGDKETEEERKHIKSPPPLYRSALFGFSRADTAVRVKKNEKEVCLHIKYFPFPIVPPGPF